MPFGHSVAMALSCLIYFILTHSISSLLESLVVSISLGPHRMPSFSGETAEPGSRQADIDLHVLNVQLCVVLLGKGLRSGLWNALERGTPFLDDHPQGLER